MSSYFVNLAQQIVDASSCRRDHPNLFLDTVEAIEKGMISHINLVTGDKEFPEDLRQKIQGEIAVNQIKPVGGGHRASDYAIRVGLSLLIKQMQQCFLEVQQQNVVTRFGRLNDDPRYILILRDEYNLQQHGSGYIPDIKNADDYERRMAQRELSNLGAVAIVDGMERKVGFKVGELTDLRVISDSDTIPKELT